MRLNPAAFNAHLGNIGQRMDWSTSFRCSCVNPNNPSSGSHDPKCPHCSGKGHLWADAVPTVCGVSSQRVQREWAQSGEWVSGDVVITIPGASPMWNMGEFDRVVLRDATERFSTTLPRGTPAERFLFPIARIERVFWMNPTTKALVEGALPAVGADNRPVWADGGPPPGTRYSITGHRYVEYFCYKDMPSNRSEHQGARLPKKVVLRLFDLLGR